MRNTVIAIIGSFLVLAGLARAADDEPMAQLNRAGEQRMLSQRIAKSFAQIGLNVQPFVAKQELDEATTRFEANLQALDRLSDPVARAALGRLRDAWQPFRQGARGVPQLTSAVALARQANHVLATAETLLADLQKTGANATLATGRLVAQAGRQRMLSQRIVKNYLLLSWGDTSLETRQELDTAVTEFAAALNALRQREESHPAIRTELEELGQHWEWMQTALAAEGANSYRLIVAEAGEAILQAADRLTLLYASR